MSTLGEFLNSINDNKKNLIRESESPKAMEKQYPDFAVSRSLSYHADAILLVNELNIRGLKEFGVESVMSYEYLLNALDKRKRFAKWQKPQKDDDIEVIKKNYKYSEEKANQVLNLFTEEDMIFLRKNLETGGKQ